MLAAGDEEFDGQSEQVACPKPALYIVIVVEFQLMEWFFPNKGDPALQHFLVGVGVIDICGSAVVRGLQHALRCRGLQLGHPVEQTLGKVVPELLQVEFWRCAELCVGLQLVKLTIWRCSCFLRCPME